MENVTIDISIKVDVKNKLSGDKYLAEKDLQSIVTNNTILYKEKLDLISKQLKKLAIIDLQLKNLDVYFQEQQKQQIQPAQENNQYQQPIIHNGQTHGE